MSPKLCPRRQATPYLPPIHAILSWHLALAVFNTNVNSVLPMFRKPWKWLRHCYIHNHLYNLSLVMVPLCIQQRLQIKGKVIKIGDCRLVTAGRWLQIGDCRSVTAGGAVVKILISRGGFPNKFKTKIRYLKIGSYHILSHKIMITT